MITATIDIGTEILNLPLTVGNFTSGESKVSVDHRLLADHAVSIKCVNFTWVYESDDELMKLAMCFDAVNTAIHDLGTIYNLTLPYLPHARQDRICNPGESYSAKVMCQMINSLGFDHVTVYDPHSEKSIAWLDRPIVIDQHNLVASIVPNLNEYVIVAPDAGSRAKASKIQAAGYIECSKTRDPVSGNITGFKVNDPAIALLSKKMLIVDDICDGGRTFNNCAMALRDAGATNTIELYVTHGLFTYGIEELQKNLNGIFVYNLMNQKLTNSKFIIHN